LFWSWNMEYRLRNAPLIQGGTFRSACTYSF
jgi:hypothetical protein